MSPARLPDKAEEFNGQDWQVVEPYYQELADRALTPETIDAWLRDWSKLEALLHDTFTLLNTAYHLDTENAEKQAAVARFLAEIYPKALVANERLKRKLIENGADLPEQAIMLRGFRNDLELFREENVPLISQVEQLSLQYQQIMGAMTVQFDGQERTVQQLLPYLLRTDRTVREAAWRAGRERQMQDRAALHDLFDRMLAIRRQIAVNAGFANYRDYRFRELGRFDYTPDDCKKFHAAIERVVVPAVQKRLVRRRERMGLDVLRPWDLAVDPAGRPPLKPFEQVDTLITRSRAIFQHVDPTLAGYFDTMAGENLLELDNRKGKAPGGYCTTFYIRQRPFIFMNAVGVHSDVQTLLHEGGHAFHSFEMNSLPLIWNSNIPMEIAEVASMSMELLAAPYITEFYSPAEAARARLEHLEGTLSFLPYMAVVDAFQHWMYENPDHSHAERDAKWLELHDRFMPGVDWSGLEEERASLWQRQLHIYEVPFYYVEYGIAQVGAWQVWQNSLRDPRTALQNYRAALALGYTRPLPELYHTAGADFFAFGDESRLLELVALIEGQLASLEAEGGN